MTHRRRLFPIAALTIVAVLLAIFVTSFKGPASPRTDPLALRGRAPQRVELSLSVASSGSLRGSGTIWLDLKSRSLRATLEVPVVTANTEIDVRALGQSLFLTSPNLADARGPVWYVQPFRLPQLSALAPILLKPDVALLTLLANARISHDGVYTTYESKRSSIPLSALSATAKTGRLPGNVDLTLTTGRSGEFVALSARFTSATNTTSVGLHVLSYHPRETITSPPPSRATTPAGPLLHQFLTSGALGSLVLPTQLLQLFDRPKLS